MVNRPHSLQGDGEIMMRFTKNKSRILPLREFHFSVNFFITSAHIGPNANPTHAVCFEDKGIKISP